MIRFARSRTTSRQSIGSPSLESSPRRGLSDRDPLQCQASGSPSPRRRDRSSGVCGGGELYRGALREAGCGDADRVGGGSHSGHSGVFGLDQAPHAGASNYSGVR